jgi:hypothetical protein
MKDQGYTNYIEIIKRPKDWSMQLEKQAMDLKSSIDTKRVKNMG